MGVVADIERTLATLRRREAEDGEAPLRTSTMTHLVWAPPEWLPKARATLAGLAERHPARTIFLIPQRGRHDRVEADATLRDFQRPGLSREILSEVIEIRLCGRPIEHPASIVVPLLVHDLPVFCRWRGEPPWDSQSFAEIVDVCDRLVVDSSEWRALPASYRELASIFDRVAVSDIAFRRTLPWRVHLAGLWPDVASVERLRVEGPRADALLLAGWLRSRLDRNVALSRRGAGAVRAVWLDGTPVKASDDAGASPSDLLSAELDVLVRDHIYEDALGAAI